MNEVLDLSLPPRVRPASPQRAKEVLTDEGEVMRRGAVSDRDLPPGSEVGGEALHIASIQLMGRGSGKQ